MDFRIGMGVRVTDAISGFEGIVIGRVEYVTGCNQYLVAPKGEKPHERPSAEWFDEQRLAVLNPKEALVLDNAERPGPDRPAPTK